MMTRRGLHEASSYSVIACPKEPVPPAITTDLSWGFIPQSVGTNRASDANL
jgi:hypothetical protein